MRLAEINGSTSYVCSVTMSDAIKISMTGVKELDTLLTNLPKQLTDKVLIGSAKHAAGPMIKAMKSAAPSAKSAKSIGSAKMRPKSKERIRVLAGVRTRANVGRRQKHDGFYLVFVEGGVEERRPKKQGGVLRLKGKDGEVIFARSARAIPARPFGAKIVNAHRSKIPARFAQSTATILHRYMKRTIKKHG